MPPAPTLYLLRHGQTEWNVQGRIQGARMDSPLTARGRADALCAARALAAALPPGWERAAPRFAASPLGRARATMEIVLAALGRADQPYELHPGAAELDYGDWSGRTKAELAADFPEQWAAREAGKWSFRPPGGESYAAMRARAAGLLDALTEDTVLVSHGGFGRMLRGVHAGLPPEDILRLDEPQDCVFVLAAHGAARIDDPQG